MRWLKFCYMRINRAGDAERQGLTTVYIVFGAVGIKVRGFGRSAHAGMMADSSVPGSPTDTAGGPLCFSHLWLCTRRISEHELGDPSRRRCVRVAPYATWGVAAGGGTLEMANKN
jgi:hypothetical protein